MGEWLVIITDKQKRTVAYYGPFEWDDAADTAANNRFVKGSPSTFRADCVPLCPAEQLKKGMS